jgi:hypothetical protein
MDQSILDGRVRVSWLSTTLFVGVAYGVSLELSSGQVLVAVSILVRCDDASPRDVVGRRAAAGHRPSCDASRVNLDGVVGSQSAWRGAARST